MKLVEMMGQSQHRNQPKSSVDYFAVVDPKTGEEQEIPIRRYFNYDSGDVGFGVGQGKSPYPAEWQFDYAEAAEDFTVMRRPFKKGQTIDLDMFTPYMTEFQTRKIFDAPDDIGEEDEGY